MRRLPPPPRPRRSRRFSDVTPRPLLTIIRDHSGSGGKAGGVTLGLLIAPLPKETIMWTRRLLLATMVAACAMSLPRHVPASWDVGVHASDGASNIAISSLRCNAETSH